MRIAAIATVLLLANVGCAEDRSPYFGTSRRTGSPPTVFHVNGLSEPEMIDPGRTSDGVGALFIAQLYEGLSVYDARDAHPTQGVARRWEKSDDNRLFRFHLRPEARWSDGKPVTARDFVYAWTRALRPRTASKSTVLHVLLNGELFAHGQLLATRNRVEVSAAPDDHADGMQVLPAGAPVRVLQTKGEYSQIARHERLPTFDPDTVAPADAGPPPAPLGWVRSSELGERADLVGVRAVGDSVLEVETERPAPYFLDLTCYATTAPMREDVVEPLVKKAGLDAVSRPENLVTNGPYSIGDWKFRYQIDTVKSPTYWRADEVKLERVEWLLIDDARSAMNLYKAGDLDFIGDSGSIPPDIVPFVSTKKDFQRWVVLNTYWYELNTRRPPLDDARVRRALNLAIDKAQLIERVTRGGQVPATHYVPDITGSGYAEQAAADRKAGKDPFAGPGFDFDPARARALLREAGFDVAEENGSYKAKGFPPLEILYNTSEGHKAIAVVLQDAWQRNLGVTVALRNEEWKVMLKSRDQGNFQVLRGGWGAEYNHPQSFLDTFGSKSPQNESGWADPEFDRLLAEARSTADPVESIRKFRAAELRAVEAMPRIPLYFYTKSTLVKPWVKGFYPNARNVHLMQWLWIDESGSPDNRPAAEPRDYPPPGRIARRPVPGSPPPEERK